MSVVKDLSTSWWNLEDSYQYLARVKILKTITFSFLLLFSQSYPSASALHGFSFNLKTTPLPTSMFISIYKKSKRNNKINPIANHALWFALASFALRSCGLWSISVANILVKTSLKFYYYFYLVCWIFYYCLWILLEIYAFNNFWNFPHFSEFQLSRNIV